MFGINAWEMIAIAVLALLIFGPERLPELASQAARLLREVRRLATGAKQDLKESLGPELSDLSLNDLDPRSFVKKNLFDPIDDEVEDVKRSVNGSDTAADSPAARQRPSYDSDTT